MKRAGFSVLELVIAMAIISILLMGVVRVVGSGEQAVRHTISDSVASTRLHRALNRIVRQLRSSGSTTLVPDPVAPLASSTLGFQVGTGWTGGAMTWSDEFGFRLDLEPSELDNGVDDDGDGFVDECQVVFLERMGTPNEQRTILLSSVREYLEGETADGTDENGNGLEDEPGLCFERIGDTVTVRLSIEYWDPNSVLSVRTLETSARLRN